MEQKVKLEDLLGGKENEFKSEFHSLYIDDVEGEIVQLQVPDEVVELLGRDIISVPSKPYKQYTLYLSLFCSEYNDDVEIIHELRRAEPEDKLKVFIDSPGGSVSEGLRLVSVFKESFAGKVEIELDPSGASMGSYIFCTGDIRIAKHLSTLMFHYYSAGLYGKGQELKANQEFNDKYFPKMDYENLVVPGFFTQEECDTMIHGDDYYLDAEEMCYRGIATHVLVEDCVMEATDYIDFLESGLSYKDYAEYLELMVEDPFGTEDEL